MSPSFNKIFANLKPKKLSLKKGDALFLQNDEVINVYFIETGRLRLQRETIEGSSAVMHIVFSGEIAAEAALFSKKYHCSAIADKKIEVSCVKKTELLNYLEKNPIAMKQLLTLYSYQIKSLRFISEIKNIRSAKKRVLIFLKNEMNANKEVRLSITLKDTAYRIALSHETFYRTLKILEKNNQIIRYKGLIKLL